MLRSSSARSCYMTSLNYSPGLWKEFKLLGDNLSQHDWSLNYLVSSGYSWLISGTIDRVRFLTESSSLRDVVVETIRSPIDILPRVRRLFTRCAPEFLFLYNAHPLNTPIARLARNACPGGIRALYLHEPFVPEKSSYGRKRAFYIRINEWLQTLTLKYTTCAIVPSQHSLSLFHMRYPEYPNAVYRAPILLPEKPVGSGRSRSHISLVGNLNRSRGPHDFLELVKCAAKREEDLQFMIVTRSDINEAIQRLSPRARGMLEVVNKSAISDEEIARVVSQSTAIFLPHKQAAQSGNIPVAFREGTPVIARDIPGLSQHVHHKENGYLFPFDPTPEQLLEAARYVRDDFSRLSDQAREDFENIFAESNFERYYRWLIQS